MGKDPDPWKAHNLVFKGQQNTNSPMFPDHVNPYGFGLALPKYLQLNVASVPPACPMLNSSGKRFLVFDQSGDHASLIFSSLGTQFSTGNQTNHCLDLPRSNETTVTYENGNSNEEMHEDTEEIDALLYSDSDEDDDEEAASTGHSPVETMIGNTEEEEVASSSVLPPPAKKRRIEHELDPSIADTASSTHCGHFANDEEGKKRAKRERIHHTVGVLRKIIPGGKGKNATAVLDEAIQYLRSLRQKAKGFGVTTLK